MKYIKDRFYNPRKRNPSLGAPVHNLFTCEERTAFSCGLWVQRYNKFLKPPNIRRSFFSRAPSELENPLRNPKATEGRNPQSYPSYISLETVSDTSDQSDHRAHSETPFFWVANAKVQQLFESTKYSEKFFFREPRSCVLIPIIYRCAQRHAHRQNLLATQKAQTLPNPCSFELRVQRYNDFSKPPNFPQTFFAECRAKRIEPPSKGVYNIL